MTGIKFDLQAAQHEVVVKRLADFYSQVGRRWEVFTAYGPSKVDLLLIHMDKSDMVAIDVKTQLSSWENVAVEQTAAERYNELENDSVDIWLVAIIDGEPKLCSWKRAWRYRKDVIARPGSTNGSGSPFYRIPHYLFGQESPDWWIGRWWE
jgi:hypothetical protein